MGKGGSSRKNKGVASSGGGVKAKNSELTGTDKQIAYAKSIRERKQAEGDSLGRRGATFAKYESVQKQMNTPQFDSFAKKFQNDYSKEELMFSNHVKQGTQDFFMYNYVKDSSKIIDYYRDNRYYGKKHYYIGGEKRKYDN